MSSTTISNVLSLTPKEAPAQIELCLKADLPVMLSGSPGIGKTDIWKQIADKHKLHLIVLQLSYREPMDLNGLFGTSEREVKVLDDKGKVLEIKTIKEAEYIPFSILPLEHTPIPAGKKGFLLFLDDLTSCVPAMQAASYRLLLEKCAGDHPLHPKTRVGAAGNLATDAAVAYRLSTASQSRLVHLNLVANLDDWVEWGNGNQIDHRLLAYVQAMPGGFHNFDPKSDASTFSCPRTLHYCSKLIKKVPTQDLYKYDPTICGTIGEAAGREFVNFCAVYTDLPSVKEIVKDPRTARIPTEPSQLYALTQMIAEHIDTANALSIMRYLERIQHAEYQFVAIRAGAKKKPAILTIPEVRNWMVKVAPSHVS